MDDRTARLESTVEQLRLTVFSLQQRLDALEARGAGGAGGAAAADGEEAAAEPARRAKRDQYDPIALLSLAGRLVLVMAGGFFLRAMTDAGVIAAHVGLALAFIYALVWLVMAGRAGARGQVPSAVFHALATAIVAFPLLIEAATRFKALTGVTSALGLTIVTAGLLLVAWRTRVRGIAWIAVLGALPASFILLSQTGTIAPFAVFLIALGLATLWLSYAEGWWGARWLAAIAADVAIVGVTLRVLAPEHQEAPQVALMLQLALVGGYVASIVIRTLLRNRTVSVFEALQTAAAVAVGFGGAIYLAQEAGRVPAGLGLASLVCGAACYGVSAGVVAKREDNAPNLYFYTTLALVLVLAGIMLVLGEPWSGVVFALIAVLMTALWSRTGTLLTLLHAVTYLVAAGSASGALQYGARAVALDAVGPWVLPGAAMLVVFAAAALSARLAAAWPQSAVAEIASATRVVIIVILAWTAAGCVIGFVAPVAAGLPDRSVDAGILATVRTAVLAVGTIIVAWVGRHARFREWGWLVYPLLIGIGVKMVSEDFKHSRPATLFIAMAFFGAALILAPRLRRGTGKVSAPVTD